MAIQKITSGIIQDGAVAAADIVSVSNTAISGLITASQIAAVNGSVITANTIANSAIQTGAVENYMNAAGLGFGMRNRIINGAMVIDQRNAGASVTPTDAQFTLDRWRFFLSQASKVTTQQNQSSVTPPANFAKYLGITSSSAYTVGSTERFSLMTSFESSNVYDFAWGTANAKPVTLSFWVYSSLTGTFGGAVRNWAYTYSYPFSYTISSANTWTYITVNITAPTAGTWVMDASNGGAIELLFNLGAGSTYSGTAGAWASANYTSATGATSVVGTNGATFYITGVQLEKGSTATSFDYRPYGTELALCQRYYYQISYSASAQTSMIGFARASTICYFNITNPVIMRTTPSIAFTGTAPAWNDGANNYALSSPVATDNTFNNSFYASMAGATAYRPGQIFGGGGGSGATTFSSEL